METENPSVAELTAKIIWEADVFLPPSFYSEVYEMNEKNYKKRFDFQQKVISKKSEEIESLKSENEKLKQKLKEKDEIIASVESMRKEMTESVKEHKMLESKYRSLIQELRQMKRVLNKEVFKNRWWLIKLLIK